MRRRTRTEALKAVSTPTRITERDARGNLIAERKLPPYADLRAELLVAMERRALDGWTNEEPPNDTFAGFFSNRDGVRVLVSVSPDDPETPEPRGDVWTVK